MSINTSTSPKEILSRRLLAIGLLILLSIAVTTGFAWIQTTQAIAPPALKLIEGLWKMFLCRCPLFPDIFPV